MKTNYTPGTVDYMLGRWNMVNDQFRIIIAKAGSSLPQQIVDWTLSKLIFVSSSGD